jgi:Na+/melibiose symporter-like transporter
MEIIAMLILKLLDPDQKIRLWGRVLPWVLMGCVVLVAVAFAWSLAK